MRGRMCKVRFQSRALVVVRAAFVPISLGPFFIHFFMFLFSFYFIVFHFVIFSFFFHFIPFFISFCHFIFYYVFSLIFEVKERKKDRKKERKKERRTRRQKQVPFRRLIACVETPHSDGWTLLHPPCRIILGLQIYLRKWSRRRRNCSSTGTAMDSMNIAMLTPRTEAGTQKLAQRSLLVRSKTRAGQGLRIWQTISNAIILYESSPADCVVKVVRRNLEGTEAEILNPKRSLENTGSSTHRVTTNSFNGESTGRTATRHRPQI